MKRTPMKRTAWPSTPAVERVKPVAKPLERPVRYAQPANDPVLELAKPVALRNPHLLRMARGQSCLLSVPGVCNGDPTTTVAAHSNLGIHGKAKARKADDHWHVHACSACHTWLDQGSAPAETKESSFLGAHAWMVSIWHGIVCGFVESTPKDRAAARWALDQLKSTTP